jgi:hypothetical protein
MNALQRAERSKKRQSENCNIREPAQCEVCGEHLDGTNMVYCFESKNGFHVKPIVQL